MECNFCARAFGYAFNGFTICPSCAGESTLVFARERGEIFAMLEWGGRANYLYTASTADVTADDQRRRLKTNQQTLALIAAAKI